MLRILLAVLSFVLNAIQQDITNLPDTVNQDVTSVETCFENFACFPETDPWVTVLRPFPPPMSPYDINVRMYLVTRRTNNSSQEIDPFDPDLINWTLLDFDANREQTVFITHGFQASIESAWMDEMANAYLSRRDANVFLVDWGNGAKNANYLQVATNTRVVGVVASRFLEYLVNNFRLRKSTVHIIGHSLGAHIAGYIGKHNRGIHRITALDAAQIGFEGSAEEVRLTIDDAENVDAIHTNAKPTVPTVGLGYVTTIGDVDFYINGGYHQPECASDIINPMEYPNPLAIAVMPVEVISELLGCSHSKSINYFIEAIQRTDCFFWGRQPGPVGGLLNVATFGRVQPILRSIISDCTLETCSPIGLETFVYPARGKFFVTTYTRSPYCIGDDTIRDRMERWLYTLFTGN